MIDILFIILTILKHIDIFATAGKNVDSVATI